MCWKRMSQSPQVLGSIPKGWQGGEKQYGKSCRWIEICWRSVLLLELDFPFLWIKGWELIRGSTCCFHLHRFIFVVSRKTVERIVGSGTWAWRLCFNWGLGRTCPNPSGCSKCHRQVSRQMQRSRVLQSTTTVQQCALTDTRTVNTDSMSLNYHPVSSPSQKMIGSDLSTKCIPTDSKPNLSWEFNLVPVVVSKSFLPPIPNGP